MNRLQAIVVFIVLGFTFGYWAGAEATAKSNHQTTIIKTTRTYE